MDVEEVKSAETPVEVVTTDFFLKWIARDDDVARTLPLLLRLRTVVRGADASGARLAPA